MSEPETILYDVSLYARSNGDHVRDEEIETTPAEMAAWLMARFDEGFEAVVDHSGVTSYTRAARIEAIGREATQQELLAALSR